jgi:mRNA interferase MazF
MGMVVKRFDVYLINVDPTVSAEAKKTRPCVVLSPDETNRFIDTMIVAPITSKGHRYPTRIPCQFDGKNAQVILDQIRTVDKVRLVQRMGRLDRPTQKAILATLAEMFAE